MTENALAKLTRRDGLIEARMTRQFDHPAAEVWRILTDAAALPQWLAPGDIELRLGGRAHIDFADSGLMIDSTVTALAPGRLLEYSWSSPGEPSRPLSWIIEPQGDSTRLFLTVGIPETENPARAFAGFEAHLTMFEALLEGVPIKFPFLDFKAARDAYQAKLEQLGLLFAETNA